MSKLLDRSLYKIKWYAGLVLIISIPIYYLCINRLWQYELDEHKIVLTQEAGKEDRFLIIATVTLLTTLFFIVLIGGFVVLNRRISKRLWHPFYNALSKIKQFDLNQQQPVEFVQTNIDEFAELNESLHKLIEGNIAVYNRQKEFADNASHELQTPLAIIQSKLDLLLQNSSLTNEQYDIIEDANKALNRVARINKNLLLLTKIENSQFMDKESIDLSGLLENMLKTFSHFSGDEIIDRETRIQPGVIVTGNRILVEILLNNLITNAINHSGRGSNVSVSLSGHLLSIANEGESALRHEQLFRRFGGTSSKTPGTGLGLALVKQICERYDWQVDYAFANGRHIFSVHF